GANKGVFINSSDVGSHSLASISVVPESTGDSVTSIKLPIVALSPVYNPKVLNHFRGCDALASKVQQEPSCNDERASGSPDSLSTSRACELRKDNGVEPPFASAEVADQRSNGQSLIDFVDPECTPQV
ncbi:hypothetical protein Ancab_022962, partial [Ancistrocladus abbreviatus]